MISDDELRALAGICNLGSKFMPGVGFQGINKRGVYARVAYIDRARVSAIVGSRVSRVFSDIYDLSEYLMDVEFVTASDLGGGDGGLGSRLFITSDQSQCTESLLHQLRRIEARIDRLLA